MRTLLRSIMVVVLLSIGTQHVMAQGRRAFTPRVGSVGASTTFFVGDLDLQVDHKTGRALSLRAKANGFDFAPGEWMSSRADSGFYQLGDVNMRVRFPGEDWVSFSTAHSLESVSEIPVTEPSVAGFDLSSLFEGSGLSVKRYWESTPSGLALRFVFENISPQTVEIGALGFPMIFNNIMHARNLEKAHVMNSFHDPYIGRDAGYVQVARLDGTGPVLLVVPLSSGNDASTPFEAWRPLLDDRTPRGTTHEGFYEWMAHSKAYAENEWKQAESWNEASSFVLEPGETRSYGVRFLIAPDVRSIEHRLQKDGMPVAVGLPGYVIPQDTAFKLYLSAPSAISKIEVEPAGALRLDPLSSISPDWVGYAVNGLQWGRARVSVHYADGRTQTIQYKVIKPAADVVSDMGRFLTNEQWFDQANDPFKRAPSVISYDFTNQRQVTQDSRAWIAGLGDEAGSGSWLTAIMKQLVAPTREEVQKMERFVDETLWGGLQYSDGPLKFGVRKSLFYYAPDSMPEGTYSDSISYGSWSSWSKEHAESVGRSYNYPHVAAFYWTMYRLARNHTELVQNHAWDWYLERAFETSEAMVRLAPDYAQFGQMEGTVFVRILEDLRRESWNSQADKLESTMRVRADVWQAMAFPFGSEMPWDSTGQEEVYAWARFFGMDEKADVTLNAILAYMPTLAHWGYNGSARRYWDFWYGGHPNTSRLERQLHHYGSALNALPVLSEYRNHPSDMYLLRVGYGGLMGALANVTEEGFAPAAFHSYPSTLANDGYSGDYGPGFLGFTLNTASYLVHDDTFGWQAFGGNLSVEDAVDSVQKITLFPTDAARFRVYVAPVGAWLELDAGRFASVTFDPESKAITARFDPASRDTPVARLRVSTPGSDLDGQVDAKVSLERGAYVIDLTSTESMEIRFN